MTVIVGLVSGNQVYLGGDAAGTDENLNQKVIDDPKVFKHGEFIFGVCGSPKVMDALRYSTKFVKQMKNESERSFITNIMIPELRRALVERECTEIIEGNAAFHGAILFGYKGKLYQIQSNFQVITNKHGYDAVGSGANVAIGAMHVSKGQRNVKRRITAALEAASIANAGVRPPFTIVSTGKEWF